MRLTDTAPAAWDDDLAFPMLSSTFARAVRTMGVRPLYATDGVGRALILLRSVPAPIIRWWTTRAKVYVSATRAAFVPALVAALRARGVSYARLGDAAWGLPASAGTCEGLVRQTTHLMVFDATLDEARALAGMAPKTRWQLRRAMREHVTIDEVRSEAALDAFCRLVAETRERMRARDVTAAIPDAFYRAVFREMVPRGEAILLLAHAQATPLAGGLFFLSRERMSYYHGASTRDRRLTALNGPTALFWHAMRVAHARGIPRFDLGAVTPTDDPAHPHHSVYHFKRGFGGAIEELCGAEIVLSPLKCRFQERVMLPAWKRMYPWYLSMVAEPAVTAHAETGPVR
jgi:hypothetical protein